MYLNSDGIAFFSIMGFILIVLLLNLLWIWIEEIINKIVEMMKMKYRHYKINKTSAV